MADKLNVLTGATGFIGSHVAEQLVERGERVRALVRPSSDSSFLQQLGVELAVGDLGDVASIRRAVDGADVVYHCAAKVSDWGPWGEYQSAVVDATRHVLEACKSVGVGRLLHASSVAVYGNPRNPVRPITEDQPMGRNLAWVDYYPLAKIRAEELVWRSGLPVTVVRPSWTYGPRDRASMPRVLDAIRNGRVRIIGAGDNLLNIGYVGDVVEGMILAANHPEAHGQAYNLNSEGEVTQRQFLDILTDAVGVPRITRRAPFRLAYLAASAAEFTARALGRATPPTLTRRGVLLISRTTQFSIAKARTQLGWQPRTPVGEAVRRTLEWFHARAAGAALQAQT